MRDLILTEIKRLAAENGGRPPGKAAFLKGSGIPESKWSGVFWARWSDALAEAGFEANIWNSRLESRVLLQKVASLAIRLGRVPTFAEMQLERRTDSAFPNINTLISHFKTKHGLTNALQSLSEEGYAELKLILPPLDICSTKEQPAPEAGVVYLLKSGPHYKIGRSDNLERRVKEISVALPNKMVLVHAIRTDDPLGIEAYWHNRFKEKRVNGEWFKLTAQDVRLFVKRTVQ